MTYYAYSEIKHSDGTVKFGEEVTQKQIGVEDDEWESYIEDQVVGEEPVPDDLGNTQSLADYNLKQATADYEAAQAGEIRKSTAKTAAKPNESTSS